MGALHEKEEHGPVIEVDQGLDGKGNLSGWEQWSNVCGNRWTRYEAGGTLDEYQTCDCCEEGELETYWQCDDGSVACENCVQAIVIR